MSLIKVKDGNVFPSVFSDFFDTDKFFGTDLIEKDFAKWIPAVNITENNKEFRIELAVPGMEKKDFKINVENDVLTISAEKQEEKKDQNERFTRREFRATSFSRSFRLPQSVNADSIDGKYDNGILKLVVPKKEEAKQKQKKEIKVS